MQTTEIDKPVKIYKFGTSGYRNDTEEGFNETVVSQISLAIADCLIEQIEQTGKRLPVLIGGDTREKSRRFIPFIANLLRERGLDVFQAETDVPSPVLAYAAKYFKDMNLGFEGTLGAILMTASHNPWPYGGYNFLTPDAAVMPTPVSKKFEEAQVKPGNRTLDRTRFGASGPAKIRMFDPYPLYQQHLKETMRINYAKIQESGLRIFYDPLYATGRNYFPRLLQDEGIEITTIHGTDERPAGYTGMPEPTGSNLTELSALVANEKNATLKVGLSNDGDADRFGVLDETGRYLNSNEVLSLILYHLLTNRHRSGVVVRSQATTHLLDALALKHGLPVVQTPVGYKYIAEEFIEHEEKGGAQVLIGGESSGGVSVLGHIPEKDGILANLLVAELIAHESLPLSQILAKVQASIPDRYVFRELGMKTERGQEILSHFKQLQAQGAHIGDFSIDNQTSLSSAEALERKYGTRDGVKIYLQDASWVLIRTSGTEPIARVYIEARAQTAEEAHTKSEALLEALTQTLHGDFGVPLENIKEKK